MAKLCLKKTSKRVSCRTRYKVEHKVREHNRKKRRAAKKDPFHKGRSAHKKLIHVPNICPFKEDILKEVADVKKRKEEDRLKQREEWKKEREAAKEGASSMAALAADAESRQAVHEHLTPAAPVEPDANEREYKLDGSLKAYYREFKKVVEAADVVLEVVDARDPLGTRCLAVEQAVLDSPGNKRLIIVLNKSDLVPRDNLDAWLKYLRRSFPTTAMKASTQGQKNHLAHRKFKPNVAVKGSNCVGASLLMSLLANYCRNKGLKTAITVGVVGMPNVGKSSLVNSLKRSRACQVGGLPGVTKQMQVVQLDSKIKLIDSPGVVMTRAPCDAHSALRNTVDVNRMRDPMPAARAILARASRAHLADAYDVKEDYATPVEFLAAVARRFGKNKRGGVPDVEVAARMLVGDWNRGKIRYHTIPPEENLDSHVSAEIVQQMAAEFNIDEVAALETEVLESLGADQAEVSSAVPTAAPMEVEGAQGGAGGGAGDGAVLGDNVTVAPTESKKKLRWRKEAAGQDGAEKPDKEAKIAGNQKLNKVKKVQFKKLKKEQARSERKTDNLADVLDNFSFEAAGQADEAEEGGPNDAYDFDTDFAM